MSNNYNRDLYKILNISFDADEVQIKSAYRRLVRLYHPDVAGANADETKFKEIQEAYEILSNAEKRKKYDIVHGYYKEKLKKDLEKKYNDYIKYSKLKDKPKQKDSFSQSVNEALDSLFHTKNRPKQEKTNHTPPVDGEDIYVDVTISSIEAVQGTIRKVNILHTDPCPKCGGRKFINEAQCSVCNGIGQIQNQKKLTVKIPKGVKQGAKVRVRKEGNKGQYGGKDGDLYLVINLKKGKFFDVEGNDILVNLPITAVEAALGADISFEIFNETVTVKIPPLTSSGQKLKLSGLGLENKDKTIKGDVIITVFIKMPDRLSVNEKSLYEKLKYYTKFDVRKEFNDEK